MKDKPFEVIDWPSNSPGLGSIENSWNFMKTGTQPRTSPLSQAEGGHPQDVDSGQKQGILEQPQQLHAQDDGGHDQEPREHDQILV